MIPCRTDNRVPSAESYSPKNGHLPARSAIPAKAQRSLRTGAGGVGGLVSVSVDGDFYFPGYDNNGNVIGYWDESGSIVAEYAYDAFGNTISAIDTMSSGNTWSRIRSITQETDSSFKWE